MQTDLSLELIGNQLRTQEALTDKLTFCLSPAQDKIAGWVKGRIIVVIPLAKQLGQTQQN